MNIVLYLPNPKNYIEIGKRAIVVPVNHPATKNVSNTSAVSTSPVQDYNPETGIFITLNTIYIPMHVPESQLRIH